MRYIIFDMEWNQPSCAEEKDPALLHGEIIQFGYFVLDERLEPLFRDEMTVRPVCYPKMNPYVSALTGITQEMADGGIPFSEAIARMAERFSDDTVLFTWGDDDMPILRENIAYHKITDIALPVHYNLQRFFCVQTDTPQQQIGLKTAAEQFGIDVNVQSHDALNDAYVTLLIAKKLDIPRGIAEYRRKPSAPAKKARAALQQPWQSEEPLSSAEYEYSGSADGFVSFCRGRGAQCPECGREADTEKFCRQGKTAVVTRAFCPEHGLFFVRFSREGNITVRDTYRLTEPLEKLYRSKLSQSVKSEYYRRLHREAARFKK